MSAESGGSGDIYIKIYMPTWGSSSETQALKLHNSALVANDATHLLISIEAHLLALGQVNRENRS